MYTLGEMPDEAESDDGHDAPHQKEEWCPPTADYVGTPAPEAGTNPDGLHESTKPPTASPPKARDGTTRAGDKSTQAKRRRLASPNPQSDVPASTRQTDRKPYKCPECEWMYVGAKWFTSVLCHACGMPIYLKSCADARQYQARGST